MNASFITSVAVLSGDPVVVAAFHLFLLLVY